MKPELYVSIYAAVVSTTVAAVQVWKHLRSGVRLKFTLIPDGMVTGGDSQFDERDLVILTITNRGDASTTIENMLLFEMSLARWPRRKRRIKSYVIHNPQLRGYPPNIPWLLDPAKKWTGVIRHRPDQIRDLHTGNYYVGIQVSHRDKPYLVQIPKLRQSS